MHRGQSTHAQGTVTQSAKFPSHTRSRRPSYNAKRHSVYHSRSDYPALRAPQFPPPRDIDAFTFLPQYLADWHMPDALWDALPDYLRKHLAALQHAGAAAMTSFQRIEEMRKELDGKVDEHNENDEIIPTRTPSLTSLPTLPNTGNQSPQEWSSPPSTPITPLDLCLGLAMLPTHEAKPDITEGITLRPTIRPIFSPRTKSFNNYTPPPATPQLAQWRAEVSTLHSETAVRMRHALRKVEREWQQLVAQQEQQRSEEVLTEEEDALLHAEAWAVLVAQFGRWLLQKKAVVAQLDGRARALGVPFALGWGDV